MLLPLIGQLVLLGLLFYIVTLIPMAEPFPQVIRVVAIVIAVLLVLGAFGINILPLGI